MAAGSREMGALAARLLSAAPEVELLTIMVDAVRSAPTIRIHARCWDDGQRLAEALGLAEADRQLRPATYPDDCFVEWRTWSGVALEWLTLVEVTAAADHPIKAVA